MEAYNPEWNELVFRNLTPEEEDANGVYLSGTDSEIDGVTAWMPLPKPYKPE